MRRTLAKLAGGANPIPAMLRRRLRLRGKRRKALALRKLDQNAGPRQLARLGLPVDPDLLFRSLTYAIDPEWTRGKRFRIGYELVGEGGGSWTVAVDDGAVTCERGLAGETDALVRIRYSDWLKLLSGEMTPSDAMRLSLTEIDGAVPPVTQLGRWIDRAEGARRPGARARGAPARDPGEARRHLGLARERRRARQRARARRATRARRSARAAG